MLCICYTIRYPLLLIVLLLACADKACAQSASKDTIRTAAVVYDGDTIEAKTLDDIYVYTHYSRRQMQAYESWTRLRNAIYITYPYAKRAGRIINDINMHLGAFSTSAERRSYIKSREKELRKEFEAPLTNLTVYQGKILMKLINRETGNNCYEIIKEYKGGLTARVYQTVAFFFETSLKQPYDASGEDADMEKIVLQVARMYGDKG